MTKIVSIVEARTITGPMKPLLLMAEHEQRTTPGSWQRVAMTTTRDPELGRTTSNEFLDAAHAAGLRTRVSHERHLFDPGVVRDLRRMLVEERPDIVETHDFKSHLLFRMALPKGPRPFRWIAYHHGYTRMSWRVQLYQQLDRISLRAADRVVTLCKPFVPVLRGRGVSRDHIRVVTNCIAMREPLPPAERAGLRASLGLGDSLAIACIGRLSPEKGHSDLFAALAMLDGLDWRLLVVGDGGERERLHQEARALGSRVSFLGHRNDPWPFFNAADIFVLPSHSEGSPLVLLEAMSAGLPVVATKVGGVQEIADDHSALLVNARAPQELADALKKLAGDPALRARLGETGRRQALAHTPAAYADTVHGIYAELLQPAP